jgi:hypothetical protein
MMIIEVQECTLGVSPWTIEEIDEKKSPSFYKEGDAFFLKGTV